jgi:fatty-acyl-CoA synthase
MPHGSLCLHALLTHAAQIHGNREIATVFPNGSRHALNYKTLWKRSHQLASALRQCGLQRGDNVATLMFNHSVHLEAHFGVALAGGVLVPLNIRLHVNDIANLMKRSEARYLLIDDCLIPRFRNILCEQQARTWIYSLDSDIDPSNSYEHLLNSASESSDFPDFLETDLRWHVTPAARRARQNALSTHTGHWFFTAWPRRFLMFSPSHERM